MWPIYFCPGCRAQVAYGDRFCGNCGVNLSCVIQQIPPQPPPLSYDYHYPCQQWGQYYQPLYDQASMPVSPNQYRQRYVPGNDSSATPISSEISELLAELFDKRLKYNKT